MCWACACLTDSGQPINGMQATLRNLLRAADLLLPLVGLLVMTLNRKYQRLGDLVAGTIVVVEERQWLTGVAKLDDPRAIQLAAYLPPNFVVTRSLAKALATYVERRRFFTPPRRREVARHLAIPLLERFGLPPDTSYDLLLCALYYRTFIADRSQDERLLAEAQAAFAANNPFAYMPADPPRAVCLRRPLPTGRKWQAPEIGQLAALRNMKVVDLLERRRPNWQELERLCDQAQAGARQSRRAGAGFAARRALSRGLRRSGPGLCLSTAAEHRAVSAPPRRPGPQPALSQPAFRVRQMDADAAVRRAQGDLSRPLRAGHVLRVLGPVHPLGLSGVFENGLARFRRAGADGRRASTASRRCTRTRSTARSAAAT